MGEDEVLSKSRLQEGNGSRLKDGLGETVLVTAAEFTVAAVQRHLFLFFSSSCSFIILICCKS